MIQCENCISLAICLTYFEFEKHSDTKYGYYMRIATNSKTRCDVINDCSNSENNWNRMKKFMLEQKGLI